MQRTGSAGHHERELARIIATLVQDPLHGRGHVDVHNIEDSHRSVLDAEIQWPRNIAFEGVASSADIERNSAAEKTPWADVSEYEVRVGHGGVCAPAPIAGGPGGRTGALRTDLEQPAGYAGDAASAGSDGDDVHHRKRQSVAIEIRRLHVRRSSIDDPRDVQAGPAHVESDSLAEPLDSGVASTGDSAPRRPGFDRSCGYLDRRSSGDNASGRLHDQERPAEASCGQSIC